MFKSITIFQKLFLFFIFLCSSLYGFLLKLPSVFRTHDKLMHSLFYFCAAVFLNILFPKRQVIILIFLVCFGFGIEYLQEYSNRFFKKRIHGRFDIEDIEANLKGLIVYAIIAFIVFVVMTISKKMKYTNTKKDNSLT